MAVSQAELKVFSSITRLNLSSNRILHLHAEFCKSLPNLEVLDLRANRIREISPFLGTMSKLKVLKLDKNEIKVLPEELYTIKGMEELTLQQNRVSHLSSKIGQLQQLKRLNLASNLIEEIPFQLGLCTELETLCIQKNRFVSFPCSFVNLVNLKELSLEWFIYSKPPKTQFVSKKTQEGAIIMENLMVLCNLLIKY
jgi:Leucine-rich repeat (LRR) protein